MFKKPNSKTAVSAAVKVGAGIAGAKLSDGIVSVMPESTNSYKKLLVAGIAILGAATVDAQTTAGEAVQAAFVGMAVKQGTDAVTDMLTESVDPQDNTTYTGKFLNAIIGHNTDVVAAPVESLNRSRSLRNPVWEPATPVRTAQPSLV
jgi:hypothetical protein